MPLANGNETPAENHFRRSWMTAGEYMAYISMATRGRKEKKMVNELLASKGLTWDDLSVHFANMIDLKWPVSND